MSESDYTCNKCKELTAKLNTFRHVENPINCALCAFECRGKCTLYDLNILEFDKVHKRCKLRSIFIVEKP